MKVLISPKVTQAYCLRVFADMEYNSDDNVLVAVEIMKERAVE